MNQQEAMTFEQLALVNNEDLIDHLVIDNNQGLNDLNFILSIRINRNRSVTKFLISKGQTFDKLRNLLCEVHLEWRT